MSREDEDWDLVESQASPSAGDGAASSGDAASSHVNAQESLAALESSADRPLEVSDKPADEAKNEPAGAFPAAADDSDKLPPPENRPVTAAAPAAEPPGAPAAGDGACSACFASADESARAPGVASGPDAASGPTAASPASHVRVDAGSASAAASPVQEEANEECSPEHSSQQPPSSAAAAPSEPAAAAVPAVAVLDAAIYAAPAAPADEFNLAERFRAIVARDRSYSAAPAAVPLVPIVPALPQPDQPRQPALGQPPVEQQRCELTPAVRGVSSPFYPRPVRGVLANLRSRVNEVGRELERISRGRIFRRMIVALGVAFAITLFVVAARSAIHQRSAAHRIANRWSQHVRPGHPSFSVPPTKAEAPSYDVAGRGDLNAFCTREQCHTGYLQSRSRIVPLRFSHTVAQLLERHPRRASLRTAKLIMDRIRTRRAQHAADLLLQANAWKDAGFKAPEIRAYHAKAARYIPSAIFSARKMYGTGNRFSPVIRLAQQLAPPQRKRPGPERDSGWVGGAAEHAPAPKLGPAECSAEIEDLRTLRYTRTSDYAAGLVFRCMLNGAMGGQNLEDEVRTAYRRFILVPDVKDLVRGHVSTIIRGRRRADELSHYALGRERMGRELAEMAAMGDPTATRIVAFMVEHGIVFTRDADLAQRLWRLASDDGDLTAWVYVNTPLDARLKPDDPDVHAALARVWGYHQEHQELLAREALARARAAENSVVPRPPATANIIVTPPSKAVIPSKSGPPAEALPAKTASSDRTNRKPAPYVISGVAVDAKQRAIPDSAAATSTLAVHAQLYPMRDFSDFCFTEAAAANQAFCKHILPTACKSVNTDGYERVVCDQLWI